MPAAPTDARLSVRLDQSIKDEIADAAALLGQSVSDFTVTTLLRRSKEVKAEESVTRLTNRDRDLFRSIVDDEAAEPNAKLAAAARAFERRYGTDE
ncbi:type II toxin-antitoxin system TacA family antitoxin [Alienimonas californiensis]|uniref:DUF1778 domain-containing protein n=1 Tax=Alienimonas californiensis TaxID=2527989 RepID=A0A517P4F2_9PLAN|nr:DUF1778 domain-containing protein [Alienimonas californiensis]QDT14233.1 hypothetical protein CA12_03020 [Alienimonas californiensis]